MRKYSIKFNEVLQHIGSDIDAELSTETLANIACITNHEVAENSQGEINKTIPAGECVKYQLIGNDDRLDVSEAETITDT